MDMKRTRNGVLSPERVINSEDLKGFLSTHVTHASMESLGHVNQK